MLDALRKTIQPVVNIIRQKPVLAIFEACLRCNSQCGYCDLPLNEGREELDREQIKTMFTHLYDEGIRVVFLQGGEPTLRKDLVDIIHDLNDIGFSQTLITNGTRLTQDFIDAISDVPVHISISLDSLDAGRYQQIRGANQLKLVLNGIERLKNYPHPKFITCIMSDINRQDILEVIEYANRYQFIPVIGAYHWDVERYGKSDLVLQYKKTAAVAVFNEVLKSGLVPEGYFREYIKDNVQWLSDKKLSACDAGRYSIAIDSSGNVAPCLALEHKGNLLDSSLSDILGNFDKASIQACSNESSCNMMCSRVIGSSLRKPVSSFKTARYINALGG